MARTLADWLAWQETLNPVEIDMGLERVAAVATRLHVQPPEKRVFTVAGTNGKGSCVAALQAVLAENGVRTGVYTSPHLVHYNERVSVAGQFASDAALVAAFERVEAARGDVSLTYFEFGTLAAFSIFTECNCAAWILEVGLGGRLDAVNVVDADYAVITTVDLDHQAWLGDTVEAIAGEKAGIMRRERPAFYGDLPVPEAVSTRAEILAAPLSYAEHGYSYTVDAAGTRWSWRSEGIQLDELVVPGGSVAQVRNQAVALAALAACEPGWLEAASGVRAALAGADLPGRLQHFSDRHEWLLDVAHNPQAARNLGAALDALAPASVTVVLGMLADKQAGEFARELIGGRDASGWLWLTCDSGGQRAAGADQLATQIGVAVQASPTPVGGVEATLERARELTPAGGLVVVCGSFTVVGPALLWLGL